MKVALIRTPTDIHPDVVEWLSQGFIPTPESKVIPFLCHLTALRQACATPGIDAVIVLEDNTTLIPEFTNKINEIIVKIPLEYDICLLSHYITSWEGITFLPGTDNVLCAVSSNVSGSYAYLIRIKHVEYLLSLFDQPLRNIPQFNVTPETISRTGRVCMTHKPLVAKIENENQKKYFSSYGF